MYIFLMVIHVIVCLVLIMVVLLQAGRGGGTSDMFGGGQPSSLFGTQTNVFLTRATEVCAVLFVVTSIGLGVLTTRQSKSLMDRVPVASASMPAPVADAAKAAETAAPAVEAPAVPAPVQEAVAAAPAAEAPAPAVPAPAANAS